MTKGAVVNGIVPVKGAKGHPGDTGDKELPGPIDRQLDKCSSDTPLLPNFKKARDDLNGFLQDSASFNKRIISIAKNLEGIKNRFGKTMNRHILHMLNSGL
ncbi:hypothetical protein HELRODRAFT_174454 [Helobdella robusta]|uniref:Uncharacterized protein n=1 Tax=Helobdella robusta TaxID=6412 RepID=T1F852_HELRO|nr:hypothetical protein HELRODRAFT_174454 [Helobdella robusta]ESO01503.1 hypothetical protein HELRODRAFT_174454 [Helobdella robusta]